MNKGTPQGAAVKLHRAGFRELVSVIPPGAELSPNSKISPEGLGKTPGRKGSKGWYGYNWLKAAPSSVKLAAKWDRWGSNVGLLAGKYPALDIDSGSAALTKLVLDRALGELGPAPVRLSRRARRLLVYRATEPIPHTALRVRDPNGEEHLIEFLGEKRQYLVHGRHPSGAEYRWDGKPLWETTPQALTEVTAEQGSTFLEGLAETLREKGRQAELVGGKRASTAPPPPQDDLKAPSTEALTELVDRLPNPATFGRENYIEVGYAVKASGQDDEEEAFGAWQRWADRWEGDGDEDPEKDRAEWDRFHPPFRVGWSWLMDLADELVDEFVSAQVEFAPDPNAPPPPLVRTENERSPLTQILSSIDRLQRAPASQGLDAVKELSEAIKSLSPQDQIIAEVAAIQALRRCFGGGAERIYRLFEPVRPRSPFARDENGELVLRLLTHEDLAQEPEFLVGDRIPSGAVGAVVGDFSTGKTWLVVGLGCAVALGEPWLGEPTRTRPVLFLVAEGQVAFHRRLLGWLVEYGVVDSSTSREELFAALEKRILINQYPTTFSDPPFEESVRATIEKHNVGLVIIDTLGKTLGPEQAENDNDVANAVTGMMSRLTAETGSSILFTHHVGHANHNRARGASAWEQGVDFEMLIVGSRGRLTAGRPMILEWRKMRDGEIPPPIHFRLKRLPDLTLAVSESSEPHKVTSAVVELAEDDGFKPSIEGELFRFVQENPGCSRTGVRARLGIRNQKADEVLDGLLQIGAVRNDGSGNHHRYHASPDWYVNLVGELENRTDPIRSAESGSEAS